MLGAPQDSLRILHVLRLPLGGLFRHVTDLASEQTRAGHSVGVVVGARAPDVLSEARLAALGQHLALGTRRIPMPRFPSPLDAYSSARLAMLARSLKVDVVHAHGAKPGALVRMITGRPKVIYTPHGGVLHFTPTSWSGRLYLGLERVLERRLDGLIFESQFAAQTYSDIVRSPRVPTTVVRNGLNASDFAFRHDPSHVQYDFVFVGELRALKGVDLIVEALARFPASVRPSVLIVGSGPDRERLDNMIRRLSLEKHVVLASPRPAPEVFATGRCLLVPSRRESLPYIVLEAAAAGIPILATGVGGVHEIVGAHLPLVPPDSAAALHAAMSEFLKAPDDYIAAAAALRVFTQEGFRASTMSTAITAFYDQLPGAPRRR